MPFTSVRLNPSVNTMMTPSQNEAGISQTQLMRYQQGMIQKYGGWSAYYATTIGSTIKELIGWEGLTGNTYLGVGATQSLSVIYKNSNVTITPQSCTSNPAPFFTTSSGSALVTVGDTGSNTNTLTTVYFNTPVSVGGLILNGAYQVALTLNSSTYEINAGSPAATTVTGSGVVPFFTVSSGVSVVNVQLPNNGFVTTLGLYYQFIAPTTLGGVTIQGPYQIQSVIDSTQFTIGAQNQGTAAATGYMNGGNAQIVYYYTIGPPASLGFGGGNFGGSSGSGFNAGGFGTGFAAGVSGTPITATDWTLANWGETLLACPFGGPLYVWSANSGYSTAQVVATAPFFNGGIFVSQPQQILVFWGSDQTTGVQDPLLVRWSDALNYTNYVVSATTWAGSFRIPTGSVIKGGIQVAQQGIIWTDIDCYAMQNVGQPLVFGFTKIGAGCGLVGPHACGILNGTVYWMSFANFFFLGPNGVTPIPCTVWNFVFQNIDTLNLNKVRCAVNSLYNEVTWFFPALNGTGQNTLYAKYNVSENEWDYGSLGRSAWIDVTVLGNPIGADLTGQIWQHEIGYNAGTVAMNPSFQTGYWTIAEGEEIALVDWVLPDMTFNSYGSGTTANLSITFYSTNFTGDTPVAYGPYNFTNTTEYINVRIRGRFMAMSVQGADLNTFWRLGRIRYRYTPSGRLG